MNTIEIYTTPTCYYCKIAKEYFKKNNFDYTEHNVALDRSKAQEMINRTQQFGVPVIIINGTPVIGFDRPKIDQLLGLKH